MDKIIIFDTLEIPETKDESLIKTAYRQKLVTVNPEDNPEGFKRLREAYEAALKYASAPEEPTPKKANDPVSLYIDRLHGIYCSLPRRLNTAEWETLLRDELLDDLDLGEDAKWALFRYLADHYRLPSRIWRILEHTFHIEQEQQKFKEHLPENFVDFIVRSCTEESELSEFAFDLLTGKDTADYDEFLDQLQELLSLLDSGEQEKDKLQWLTKIKQKIAFMDTLGISYPYYDLVKARYALKEDRKEDALSTVRTLLPSIPEDSPAYLVLGCANILYRCGQEEEAEALFRSLLDQEAQDGQNKNPRRCSDRDIYAASLVLAGILLHRKEYSQACDYAGRANDLYESQEAEQILFDCHTGLIGQMTGAEASAKELTLEEGLRLAWCYINTNRAEEGLQYFKEHPVLDEDTMKCHRAKAVLCFSAGRCGDALQETRLWRGSLETQSEADSLQLCQSYDLEAKIYARLYSLQPDKKSHDALSHKEAAFSAFDEAGRVMPGELNAWLGKVMFLRSIWEEDPQEEYYREAAALCEKMKDLNRNYYWAYHYAQEAYEKLDDTQKVLENFYEARRVYMGMPELFERAARVFQMEDSFREMGRILQLAEKSGVESTCLKVMKLEYLRETADSEKLLRETDAYGRDLVTQLEERLKQDWPEQETPEQEAPEQEASKDREHERLKEMLGEAYRQLALLHDDNDGIQGFHNLDDIERWAKRSLELDDTFQIRYFLGYFYLYQKQDHDEAYRHLKICEETGTKVHWVYYRIGRCHEHWKQWNDAIESFKKGMALAPDEDDYPWRIAWLYRAKYRRTGQPEYYEEALKHLVMMEQFGEESQEYGEVRYQYADLYLKNGEYERALAEIDHALEEEEEDRKWCLKGEILELLGRSQEALTAYERCIEISWENEEDYDTAFYNVYRLFGRKKAYREGLQWFEARLDRILSEDVRDGVLDHMKSYHLKLGDWQSALDILKQRYNSLSLSDYVYDSWEQEGDRIVDMLDAYLNWLPEEELRAKTKEAISLLEDEGNRKLASFPEGKRRAYGVIGYIYSNYLLDYEESLAYYQKALEQAKAAGDEADNGNWLYIVESVMDCLWHLGRPLEARQYRDLYMEIVAKDYEECAELGKSVERLYVEDRNRQRKNIYRLFKLELFCGEYDRAEELLRQLESAHRCWNCRFPDCSDAWECRGYLALVRGERQEAEACFERAAANAWPQNANALMELKRLRLS